MKPGSIRMDRYVRVGIVVLACLAACVSSPACRADPQLSAKRNAYFGDLHLHTSSSFDAYLGAGARVTPDMAFRFAKGRQIQLHGRTVQRTWPLDFLAVTEHPENLGLGAALEDPDSAASRSEIGRRIRSFAGSDVPLEVILQAYSKGLDEQNSARSWQESVSAANRNYQPGTFTTFIAFEWASESINGVTPSRRIHRNLIFAGAEAPPPFTTFQSKRVEDLWSYMEAARARGIDSLAITNHPKLSAGLSFALEDGDGRILDASYARRRARNEPLAEIATTSAEHDSTADVSPQDLLLDRRGPAAPDGAGSTVRGGLGRGLLVENRLGINPFRIGVVGSTDSHSGLSISGPNSAQVLDVAVPAAAGSKDLARLYNQSPGPLTGVWAEENTRAAIFAALERREVFATSGPRIKVRLFGGWDFQTPPSAQPEWVQDAYVHGAPMGGVLPPRPRGKRAPRFLIWAEAAPDGAPLARAQIIKISHAGRSVKERIFDVAGAANDGQDRTAPARTLAVLWEDPEFDAAHTALYYLRVLETSTPRLISAFGGNTGLSQSAGQSAVVQQRAWSSPIWYRDDGESRRTTDRMSNSDATPTAAPLIERARLFGNPARLSAQVSPDGQWLAWIAPLGGAMNLWVAPARDVSKARPLLRETTRAAGTFRWAPDSRAILYLNESRGDGGSLLHAVDVVSGAQRLLTPFDKARVQIAAISSAVKDCILIGLNRRDPRWYDIYSLNLNTGESSPMLVNTGDYAGFRADEQLNLRLTYRSRRDGGRDYFQIRDGKVDTKVAYSVSFDDVAMTRPLGYTVDGKTLYWLDSRGRDTAALFAMDVASGKSKLVAERADSDLGVVLRHPSTGVLQAYQANYMKPEWHAIDPELAPDVRFLNEALPEGWTVTSRSDADDLWTLTSISGNAAPAIYMYERGSRRLKFLFSTRPELDGAALANMQPFAIESRDGLTQVSYLTLPPGSDGNRDAIPDRPLPMVLYVHDGPWARESYEFNVVHQWLANRGYAVLSPNFRSSTGFGKAHLGAGNLEWGAKMHDDLVDAVEWAIARRIAAPGRIAIMGSFYGGYATLVGLTRTPKLFACGVELAGPLDLSTMIGATPAHLESERVQLHARVGNPTTEAGRRFLDERSPLSKADSIERPLMIVHTARELRVKPEDIQRVAETMRAKKAPVTYVLFPDEGRMFVRPENSIAFYALAEEFLKSHLGGRSEPMADALRASSADIVLGAEHIPAVSKAR